jgi:hypothetical protein
MPALEHEREVVVVISNLFLGVHVMGSVPLRTQLSFQQHTPSDCTTLQRQVVDRALGPDCNPFS